MTLTPAEKAFRQAWREFRDYAEKGMGYTNRQNLHECLNGAGAFIEFFLGRKPEKGMSYATDEGWRRG